MAKMTMHIDAELLARVMKLTGLKTKTETVEFALREAERKKKLTQFLSRRKLPAGAWQDSLDPSYDYLSLRVAEMPEKGRAKRGSG